MKRGPKRKFVDVVALRATVIAELQRLAVDGRAPLQIDYDVQKRAGPQIKHVLVHLGISWTDLVAEAGLRMPRMPQQKGRPHLRGQMPERGAWPVDSLAEEINRYEPAHWNDRYSTALAVIPTPTRVEVVVGRTLAGDPCRIVREYRMVR